MTTGLARFLEPEFAGAIGLDESVYEEIRFAAGEDPMGIPLADLDDSLIADISGQAVARKHSEQFAELIGQGEQTLWPAASRLAKYGAALAGAPSWDTAGPATESLLELPYDVEWKQRVGGYMARLGVAAAVMNGEAPDSDRRFVSFSREHNADIIAGRPANMFMLSHIVAIAMPPGSIEFVLVGAGETKHLRLTSSYDSEAGLAKIVVAGAVFDVDPVTNELIPNCPIRQWPHFFMRACADPVLENYRQ